MAKVLLSGLILGITGSLSGSVFQNTAYGLQLRTKVSPRNQESARKQRTRQRLAANSRRWRTLTDAQRLSWRINELDLFGNKNYYVGTNQLIEYAGFPVLDLNTEESSPYQLTMEIDGISDTAMEFHVTNYSIPLPTDTYLNVYCTPQLKNTTVFVGVYQYLYLMSFGPGIDIDLPLDIITEYTAEFGTPTDGSKIGIACTTINVATGEHTLEARSVGTVNV